MNRKLTFMQKSSKRAALVALAIALGAAACGDESPSVDTTGAGAPAPVARPATPDPYAGMTPDAAEQWADTTPGGESNTECAPSALPGTRC